MKSIFYFLLAFTLFLFLSSCTSNQLSIKDDLQVIKSYSPNYPILVGKANNPIYRINIQAHKEKTSIVESFLVSLEGTSDLSSIKKASIFYTSEKEGFSTEHLYAETSDISESILLSNSQMVADSSNYFWLSISLQDDANMDDIVKAIITQVVVDKVSISVKENNASKRIGHALRQHNDDGVDTYRIPGLATTNKGTLIAVYDVRRNGSVDLQEDVDVGMHRSTDGGQTWGPMKIIMDMGEWGGLPQKENGIGDPSILVDRQTNTIWVSALWLHGHPGERAWFASQPGMNPKETGQFILVKSEDDGLTWSEPINITSQIKKPEWNLLLDGPGKGIIMEDGTLVFPAQYKDENEVPHSTIISSKDRGQTWTIGTGAKSQTTEAQVVELSDGSLMLNMRDDRGSGPNGRNGSGARSVAITKDLGKTWVKHPSSRKALPEPVCMASLIKHTYKGEILLLFSNPSDQYVRQKMTIKVSHDEGMSWDEKYFTLIDEGRGRGYSCMTSIDENIIGILYEGSQADMVFQRIKMTELISSKN